MPEIDVNDGRLDIEACEENLDHYAQAGDARSCRDIGIALARALAQARRELVRRDAIHEADEAAMLQAEPARLRELVEWIDRAGENVTKDQIITRARKALGKES